MAKRKSSNFLPGVFQTLSNKRFLNTTLDPLIQEPALKKIYGYIGQQDQSPVFQSSDYYIAEGDSYSQFYQLEPGTVIKKKDINSNTYKISNVYNYSDLLNQIAADGGVNNDHQRLFNNRYYSYNGFVDLDKLTNFQQYYWVPKGPYTVDVTAAGIPSQQAFYFHRVSYTANNQTELQSAAIGRSGYSVDGYTNENNPTITLKRGGTYTFNVNQGGHRFWIQTEIGTSGVSTVQSNISTRNVLGVANNGIDYGTITFTVPLSTDQDTLIALPSIQNVDMVITDYNYSDLQGINYDNFIQYNALDGVRAFDTKIIYLTQENKIFQIAVQSDRTIKLTDIGVSWPNNYKCFVNQGDIFGHTFVYKNEFGVVEQFPTISAPLNILYYQDADNELIYGTIQLVDPDPVSLLNVNDIIGRDQYTSPNGVQFTSGLKIRFTGYVTPSEYANNEYIVENVGKSIKLIKYSDLVTPEVINENLGDLFGTDPAFDDGGFSGTSNSPEQKDYITINRASMDGNSWSRNNRWFHRDVLQYSADKTGQIWTFDSTQQAKRPIVEFLPNYKLYNYGTNYAGSVTAIDSITTNALANVEGQNSFALQTNGEFNSDGIQLLNGVTVLFVNDSNPTVRQTIYRVETVVPRTAVENPAQSSVYAYSPAGTNVLYPSLASQLFIGQAVSLGYQTSTTTAATVNGSTNINVLSTNGLSIGQTIVASGINTGTVITSISPYGSVSTTATTTSGSNSITVSSATSLAVGQNISGTNIPANTIITGISGTTISLNNSATASGSGITVTATGTIVTISAASTLTTASTLISFIDPSPSPWIAKAIPANTTITSVNTTNNSITISNNLAADLTVTNPISSYSILLNTTSGSNIITLPTVNAGGIVVGQTVTGPTDPSFVNPPLDVGTVYKVKGIVPSGSTTTIYLDNNAINTNSAIITFSGLDKYTQLVFTNSVDQIHLVPVKTVSDGDNIVAMLGKKNQGNVFYYNNNSWTLAQIRNSRPQFPLFDIIDKDGDSIGDQSIYPSSDFAGTKLFGYAIGPSTNIRDSVLGFPIVRSSVGNIGDIVFQNYYNTDVFNYNLNLTDKIKNINIGYAAIIKGWKNYSFANGWATVADKSKQYITKTFTATQINKNNFDLGVIYNHSYYENNLFVYINNVLQSQSSYTLKTSSLTSQLSFTNDLAIGDRLFVKIDGVSANYKETYTMPRNLTNNSENSEFNTITLGQLRNHLIEIGHNSLELVGEPAGKNNFRDINFNEIGGKLLQHSASLRPASLMFANNDVDPIRAIQFTSDSYHIFKNQLIDFINNLQFPNPNDYKASLDIILNEFSKNSNVNNNFYYSDMIASGSNYILNSYTIADTTYRNFNLVSSYTTSPYNLNNETIKGYNAVLIYLNDVLLLNGNDYTIDNFTVSLQSSLSIARNDVLKIYEYTSTVGCSVPATPTKLGIYPKFKPEIILDNTYVTPQNVIIGHDGSVNVAWNDYRDYILLEYEKRVYNNIFVNYQNNSDFDLISVAPGAFRITDYSISEWTQLISASYLSWANQNNVDIFTNNTTTNDSFSYNYSNATDKVFGQTVPGFWRGIFNYFYDTDRPHTHPWEMLGFVQQPSWWENRYGPAPYSSENQILWGDLELGLLYNGAPNKTVINTRYARPGLSKIIPVDSHGNLLSPQQCIVATYDPATASNNWVVGDQSPQETAWRRSSSYPFAVQIAWCLAKPAEYCALKYNTRDLVYNSNLDQIININYNNRKFDYSVTGESQYIPGINVWIRELLISNNLDPITNWTDIATNSSFNLVYKMSGFTDKSYLTIVADQISPQSNNVSVLIPQENYQIKVTKSAPVARAIYSAVIVQKTEGGYQVSGFDKSRPYFLTIPSRPSTNNYGISVGNATAIIYKDSENSVISYPYGSIFATTQQVVDFLVSYGRYLESQGFVFNGILADNKTTSDWVLAAKEFLFFDQQQWGNNTVIGLTPAGTSINFVSPYGIVDQITNDHNYTKVVDSDGVTLTGKDYRVYREDNSFSIELKNAQKGIHLLDIAIVQYEHTLIFDNQTVFADILYDEQVGSRQFRLRLDGVKTNDWNGSLYAPGFFVNVSDIPQWVSYNDYYTGDIVLFKNQYYAAQNFIPGTQKFVASDWYQINGDMLSKQLIPNMASGAAQFANFYNPDTADLNSAADILSKHSTGFQPRQYFTDLGLDITSQYKFYLGMINQKGTQAVLNAFLRNQQKRIDSDITTSEQWAIKLGEYGGTNNIDKLEFSIGNAKAINSQYLFAFINQNDERSADYNTVKPSDLLIAPKNYRTNIFSKTENQKQIVPYAGPVTTTEVSATVFDINKIYNISGLNPILGESSKIWIAADSANQWGVYRVSQTGPVFVTNVSQTSPTELQFTTNTAHNLSQYDYVMLKNARITAASTSTGVLDLSGFYRISSVTGNTFKVKIVNNTTVASGKLTALVFKLVNVRFTNVSDFANFTPVRGWTTNEIVYIDNGPSGYEVKQNIDVWKYNETRSPVYTTPSDNFGSSIKMNNTQGFGIVGASGKNGTGEIFAYGKTSYNSWQELSTLVPDSRHSLFGNVVDMNDNNIAVIGAPGSNGGAVYTAGISSQSLSINQVIHYDNLYAVSAPVTTSNGYILISNVYPIQNTANAIAMASYSLANFANGMTVVGNGISSGTRIANISYDSPYHKIGLTKPATISSGEIVTIYPVLAPNSSFGSSVCTSADGNWMFVGEPTSQKVFVYKYQNVVTDASYRNGDGTSTTFILPASALGKGLGSRDVTVYANSALQIPDVDYIKTPGQESITFYNAPANGLPITLIYQSYFKEVNQIVNDDPESNGFGSSVSCTADGRQLVVGAYTSNATLDTTYSNAGKAYIYERTVENFVGDGVKSLYQLSNAFANSDTLTTTYVVTNPSVTVDGNAAIATFNYSANTMQLANVPAPDATIAVETNQFVITKIATTDIGQNNSNLGQTVKISLNDCSVYSGAPGWNQNSTQNGAVFRWVNVPRQYGVATGTNTNVSMTAGWKMRINDWLVTFVGGNAAQCVADINAVSIPGITASLTDNGAVQIVSDSNVAYNKIRLRNELGDPLNAMGIVVWQFAQKMFSPSMQDTARFGESISLSPDGNTLVVGATLSNTKLVTNFDNSITKFDAGTIKFIDKVYRSGAAHIFEYQPSATETASDQGSFIYASLLNNTTASTLDRFATAIDVSNNFILVSAPHANILGNPTGAMYAYYNKNSSPVWTTIRSEGEQFDSRLIERAYIYDSSKSKLIADLPIIDLMHNQLPISAESYIDYTTNYDPAVYSNVPTTISFAYDKKNNWGEEKVGKLWWDTNSIKYYDNRQGDTLENFINWGLAFPASSVAVYEWIESDVLPKEWAKLNPLNQPLYTINDVYSTKIVVDSATGLAVTKYYFWVRNSTRIDEKLNRPTAYEIQTAIANPRVSSEPFAAIINSSAIAIYNAQSIVTNSTNLVIEYKNSLKPQLTHSEWTTFDDGSDLGIAVEFINKINDSLTGQDSSGRIVPDPTLPIGQKYGMSVRPRQSVFSDQYTARKLYIEQINEICQVYPMILTRGSAVNALNVFDPLPSSDKYKTSVQNITELGYLDKNVYKDGDNVLVISDSTTYNSGWSLYTLNVVFPNTRTWNIIQTQKFNVNNYWNYSNWYSADYSANDTYAHTIENETQLSTLTLNVNDIIYIKTSTNGGWKIVLVKSNGLELLGQENATIQFNSKLYSLSDAGQGFEGSSLEATGFATDNNLEFNIIFGIIRDLLLTNEYRTEFKKIIKLMIDTIATQHLQTDWMMKTSLIDIYHRVRGLDILPVYLPQPETIVTDFFNEVKPFHTKLKQYIAKYDNSNNVDYAYSSITDFDLQPYYNTAIAKYRSPQLGNTLDSVILSSNAVYKPWLDNHKYSVSRIDVINSGSNYTGATTATITGDGTGATAQVYIQNGGVYDILVINGGTGYTYATVTINGTGTGASAVAIVDGGVVRNINTYMKFDRYTYFNNIQDWSPNTAYNIDNVIVYDAQPYRVIIVHTSGSTFDFTKFLPLVVKVWYPFTEYALDDIVIYKNNSYKAIATFTSDELFDTNNLVTYNGLWLDNAADRVWAYYSPTSGMAGRDLAQVMIGMEYGGVGVKGPDFKQSPYYDINNFDSIPYDYITKDVENVLDVYGNQAEDTYIRSEFTDSSLGYRPEDIDVNGGKFVDTYSSHAPEEFVPGIMHDTLEIKVRTLPVSKGAAELKIFTANYNGLTSFSFDMDVTGVDYPMGGIEKFFIIDSSKKGPIAESVDYTVDWQNKNINILYTPTAGTFWYCVMWGSTGVNPVFDQDYVADGVQTDFDIPDNVLTAVEQAYVKVNGQRVSNWSLVNKTLNGKTILAVRFTVAPNAGDYVQVHLYNFAVGKRAYSEVYEQTFNINAVNYPTGYNFTLTNPEEYVEPLSAYAIVRLNGNDLTPPQQSYYVGDAITTSYSMTSSWKTNIANLQDGEIMVIVDGKVAIRNTDYTIYHDPANLVMPVINFVVAPPLNSKIIISDSNYSDYKIYDSNQLWLNSSITIPLGSVLTVLTQGNHDVNAQYTKLFSGSSAVTTVVDNGLDSVGFDSVGFDNELSNIITGNVNYTLPYAVTDINNIYITLRNPNTSGGFTLIPYKDFILTTPTVLTLSASLNINANSTIVVRIFAQNTRQRTLEYRIFKDIQDITRYYAVWPSRTTKLTRDLKPIDHWIYCESVANLQSPDPNTNTAGVVVIDGERIVYTVIDTINNRLGGLRRGTAGTGAALHQAGSLVIDSGSTLEIPNSRDVVVTATTPTYLVNGYNVNILINAGEKFLQGKFFTNIGETLQTSNTQAANFIREL